MRRVSFLALLICAACATTQGAQTGPAPVVTPLPEDPLALVVEDVEAVAVVRVQELQSSPLFERLRPYVERASCSKLSEWDGVLKATRRAALATRRKPEQAQEWLAVLDGQYTDADARRLLEVVVKESQADAAAPARDAQEGRFSVTEQGALAVSVLDGRLLVLGTQAWQRAAVGSIAKPVAKFADTPLWRVVGTALGCAERSACLLSVAEGQTAHQIGRGLASTGAKVLGQQLQAADSALGLTLREGASLGLSAQLGSPDSAASVERGLRDWLWQVNLVVRLTGLPAVFDQTRLSTQASLVRAELDVSRADLENYLSRAEPLIEGQLPDCP